MAWQIALTIHSDLNNIKYCTRLHILYSYLGRLNLAVRINKYFCTKHASSITLNVNCPTACL